MKMRLILWSILIPITLNCFGQRSILVKFNYSKDSVQHKFDLLILDSISSDSPNFIFPKKYDDKIYYNKKEFDKLIGRLDTAIKYAKENIDVKNEIEFEINDNSLKKTYKFPFINYTRPLFAFLLGLSNSKHESFPIKILQPLKLDFLYTKFLEDYSYNSCIYISYSYGQNSYSGHNLILSTYTFWPIIDTTMLIEPLGILYFDYIIKRPNVFKDWIFWDVPSDYTVNSEAIKYLDSLLSNNSLSFLKQCNEKDDKKHLTISFFREKREDNYSRCIYYDKNYFDIFEFCYLIESIKDPDYFWARPPESYIEWIFESLIYNEPISYNTVLKMYADWKKENKKE